MLEITVGDLRFLARLEEERAPSGRELVRLVLLGRLADAVRSRPAADRVEHVEPVGDAAQRRNGLIGFAPVETITLFVSR